MTISGRYRVRLRIHEPETGDTPLEVIKSTVHHVSSQTTGLVGQDTFYSLISTRLDLGDRNDSYGDTTRVLGRDYPNRPPRTPLYILPWNPSTPST